MRISWFAEFFLFFILITGMSFAQDKEQSSYVPLSFEIEGSNISGIFFQAMAANPAPTVILANGYPGREGDIFGLGSFLKNEGVNTYVFNYRGTWKSEGLFSITNAVEDVIRSIEFLKRFEICKKHNIDTTNITIIGYSFGGGIVILSGKSYPAVTKIISIAGTNLKITADKIAADTAYRRNHLLALKSGAKVIRGIMNGEETHEWILAHKNEIDLLNTVEAISDKKILLIGGWNDNLSPIEENLIPLYRSFQRIKSSNCKIKLLETNHSFSNVLPELQQCILNWIKN
jgi:uncharacterized protein